MYAITRARKYLNHKNLSPLKTWRKLIDEIRKIKKNIKNMAIYMSEKEIKVGRFLFNQIYLGDSLDIIKDIPTASIDLILEDMPLPLKHTTACEWDVKIDLQLYWETRLRILKPAGVVILTGSQPFTSKLVMSNYKMFYKMFKYELIWEKNYRGGFILAKKQPMKYHENILIFTAGGNTYNLQFEDYAETTKVRFKNDGKINSKKMQDVNYNNEIQGIKRVAAEVNLGRGAYPKSIQRFKGVPNCNGLRKHPTQKPVGLFEYLIRTYTNEGDLVFDGFGGSGTTAIAAYKSKRNFIVIEKEKKYFDLAVKRLDIERAQHTIF